MFAASCNDGAYPAIRNPMITCLCHNVPMHTLTKLSRIAARIALRAACLFGVGLVLGFAGFTASTMSSNLHLSVLERSAQRPISGSLDESGQVPKGPHLVASSGQVFQARFP
jgi:hypothetical protein